VALDTPGELINRLAGISTITTSGDFPLAEIQTLTEITKIQRNGSQLHLQTDNIPKSLRSILDIAEQHDIKINDLHIKQPNLEDVFLNLTGCMIRN
jgi:ABC-2 type transport system ATP-binding protein